MNDSDSVKNIYMVSGNKGGVGKSLFCLFLASALHNAGRNYAVFDGDGRTGDVFTAFNRRVPAYWGDFRYLRPDSLSCDLVVDYGDAIIKILKNNDDLIVNTPDGADSTLIKWFDTTLKYTEENNCRFKMAYLLSDRPDGLEVLDELILRFSFLHPVRNLHFGTENLFAAFNQKYAGKFNSIIDFPKLRGEEVRMLFDLKTSPFEAMAIKRMPENSFTIPALSRSRIFNWQRNIEYAIENLLDDHGIPNTVAALRA